MVSKAKDLHQLNSFQTRNPLEHRIHSLVEKLALLGQLQRVLSITALDYFGHSYATIFGGLVVEWP